MGVKYRILVVDDDPDMRKTLRNILVHGGYDVEEAESGKEMSDVLGRINIDLVLLDWVLPDRDGIELAHEIRHDHNIPFIMLTGRGDVVDKVVGLEVGADDYVTKPFNARELTARVGVVLRRFRDSSGAGTDARSDGEATLRFNDWTLDLVSGRLFSPEGQEVPLTTYEFKILSELAKRPNRVINRDQILDLIAGRDWAPTDRSVDVLIGKLRRKLQDDPRFPTFIRTVRNMGYMFVASINKTSRS